MFPTQLLPELVGKFHPSSIGYSNLLTGGKPVFRASPCLTWEALSASPGKVTWPSSYWLSWSEPITTVRTDEIWQWRWLLTPWSCG